MCSFLVSWSQVEWPLCPPLGRCSVWAASCNPCCASPGEEPKSQQLDLSVQQSVRQDTLP